MAGLSFRPKEFQNLIDLNGSRAQKRASFGENLKNEIFLAMKLVSVGYFQKVNNNKGYPVLVGRCGPSRS